MLHAEFSKGRKWIRQIIGIVLALAAAVGLLCLCTYQSFVTTDSGYKDVSGIKGLSEYVSFVHDRSAGIFNDNKLQAMLSEYKENRKTMSVEDATLVFNQKHPEYESVLSNLYDDEFSAAGEVDPDHYDFAILTGKPDLADAFFRTIEEYADATYYSKAEITYADRRAASVSSSFQKGIRFDVTDHWLTYMSAKSYFSIILAFLACFLAARLYCSEKENGMNRIMVTAGRREHRRISRGKFATGALLLAFLYAAGELLLYLLILRPYGRCGWNSPVQIAGVYYSSFYKGTLGQLYVFALPGTLVLILSIYAVACLVSLLCRNSLMAIVMSAAVTMLPTVLGENGGLMETRWYNHLMNALAFTNLDPSFVLQNYSSFGFGGSRMPAYPFAVLLSGIIFLAAAVILPACYRRSMQV